MTIDFKVIDEEKIDGVKLIFPSVASDDRGNIWTSYLKNDLKNVGHKLVERQSLGRMDCILVNENNLEGGADKRGDNIALGY